MGKVRYRGQLHPATHAPIVDAATFEAAGALLAERGRRVGLRRANSSDYLLSGLVRCLRCGAQMVGSAANGHGGRCRYYTCHARLRHGMSHGCDQERIPAEALEEAILELVVERLKDSGLLERAVARVGERAGR